ncbi:hypothetical protein [Rhizobium leguminosarum]|jgi:hypothetical protein|uniref:hypothetical protein n=1 Tax=Rhizobium leguminosarum TaxID=384 RepID=UPI002E113E89|nr:hypothetical protein U8Q02_42635 [Rhizobium leguminosarum]
MTAEFISRHIAWTLPESLYDLADMDDSTPGGRRFLMCLILAHAAVASYLAGVLVL